MVEGTGGVGVTLGVAEGRVGVAEMLTRVGMLEGRQGLEESGAATAAPPPPFL